MEEGAQDRFGLDCRILKLKYRVKVDLPVVLTRAAPMRLMPTGRGVQRRGSMSWAFNNSRPTAHSNATKMRLLLGFRRSSTVMDSCFPSVNQGLGINTGG